MSTTHLGGFSFYRGKVTISRSHFLLEISILIFSQWVSLCWFVGVVFCVSVACDCLSVVLVLFVLHWLVLLWEWVVMVTKRREEVRGSRRRSVRKEFWQMQAWLVCKGKHKKAVFEKKKRVVFGIILLEW